MSKQLLHTYQSHVVVAALNDRAFAVVKDTKSSHVFELMAANPGVDVDASKDGTDQKQEDKNDNESAQEKKKQKKQNENRNQQDKTNPHEIQAVCSTEISSTIWLAVSREDKTLSLYSVPPRDQDPPKKLSPTVTYSLPKRARCLAFSSISPSSSEGTPCNVIIAGDLSGDAIAFPMPAANAEVKTGVTSTTRRLLLGHTASMLTGLNIVPTSSWKDNNQQKQLILTADRDEKVRVSYFPETHITCGYLLGHSSFISSMDAGISKAESDDQSSRALCITGSGDGTVRLWDYQLCKEVGMVPVVIKKSDGGDNEDEDEKMPAEEDEHVDMPDEDDMEEMDEGEEFDEDGDSEDLNFDCAVPLSVALGPNAESVIVARDGINYIDVHPIPPPPVKSGTTKSMFPSHFVSLHKKQSLDCSSQPLAVRALADGSVLVLVKEPEYLIHYVPSGDGEYENSSSTSSPFSMSLREAVKDKEITMPITTLEKDDDGEWKLKKNKVNDPGDFNKNENEDGQDKGKPFQGGLHWNDASRKDTAKEAERRRRKRRRGGAKEETTKDKSDS